MGKVRDAINVCKREMEAMRGLVQRETTVAAFDKQHQKVTLAYSNYLRVRKGASGWTKLPGVKQLKMARFESAFQRYQTWYEELLSNLPQEFSITTDFQPDMDE